ncbi:hypothetical protein AAMO2058_001593000 [Amorphochlora amoebiformis]|mmetsp:Transcript_6354/g.9757  ORF Transcript_6354/g.9757 Transcript_6354/m.9757 type:complete len:164 (-) Transcript_6354:77-568(-)
MDPEVFARQIERYRVVRQPDWQRSWSVRSTRKEEEKSTFEEQTSEKVPSKAEEFPDASIEDFFGALWELLKSTYGREVGGQVATAFKTKYFEDLDRMSLEDIDDLAKAFLQANPQEKGGEGKLEAQVQDPSSILEAQVQDSSSIYTHVGQDDHEDLDELDLVD